MMHKTIKLKHTMKAWSWGFILTGVFLFSFNLGYPYGHLANPSLSELLTYNPVVSIYAIALLLMGITNVRRYSQGNTD